MNCNDVHIILLENIFWLIEIINQNILKYTYADGKFDIYDTLRYGTTIFEISYSKKKLKT